MDFYPSQHDGCRCYLSSLIGDSYFCRWCVMHRPIKAFLFCLLSDDTYAYSKAVTSESWISTKKVDVSEQFDSSSIPMTFLFHCPPVALSSNFWQLIVTCIDPKLSHRFTCIPAPCPMNQDIIKSGPFDRDYHSDCQNQNTNIFALETNDLS